MRPVVDPRPVRQPKRNIVASRSSRRRSNGPCSQVRQGRKKKRTRTKEQNDSVWGHGDRVLYFICRSGTFIVFPRVMILWPVRSYLGWIHAWWTSMACKGFPGKASRVLMLMYSRYPGSITFPFLSFSPPFLQRRTGCHIHRTSELELLDLVGNDARTSHYSLQQRCTRLPA